MPLLFQVALVLGVGLVVLTLVWMMLDWLVDRKNTHVKLVRELIAQFGYVERTVRLGRTIEATKTIDGLDVTFDFGLSMDGYEVLAFRIDLSDHLVDSFNIISKNHNRDFKTRGMGDERFDKYFACLRESAQGVSFLESGLRRRLVQLAKAPNINEKHLVRIHMGQLVVERMQEVADFAEDRAVANAYFHQMEALVLHLAEWVKRDRFEQLSVQIKDDQSMSWRCESLRLFLATCKDAEARREIFLWTMAQDTSLLHLKEIAYLYASEQFELALWSDRESWRSQILWALEHTQHDQAIKRIGQWFFHEYTLDVFDQFNPDNTLHVRLLQAAATNVPSDQLIEYFRTRLLSGSAMYKESVLNVLTHAHICLPLSLLNTLIDNWQTYSTLSLKTTGDELPAILRALMLWHPDLVEDRMQQLLAYPSPRVRQMLLEWLMLHGTQRSLFRLHQLCIGPAMSSEAKRAKDVIAAIMERLDQLPQGALTLSSVDDMHGQLSMMDLIGEVTMVDAPNDMPDAPFDAEDSGEVIFDLDEDVVLGDHSTGEYPTSVVVPASKTTAHES